MRAAAYHCIFLLLLTVTSRTDFFLQLMISSSFVTCCLVCFRSGILTENMRTGGWKCTCRSAPFPTPCFIFWSHKAMSLLIIRPTALLRAAELFIGLVYTHHGLLLNLLQPRALQKTRRGIWVCTCSSIFVTTCLVYALVLIKNKNTLEQYLWYFFGIIDQNTKKGCIALVNCSRDLNKPELSWTV